MTASPFIWIAAALAVGVLLGACAGVWWQRRQPRSAAPAAHAAGNAPACTPRDALPPFPVEIHLVLNVLNRLVMALSRDEHAQEGAAALADYLAALSRMRSNATQDDPANATKPIEMYWRMSEWQHRGEPAVFNWASNGTLTAPAGVWTLIDEVQQTLRGLEGLKVSDVAIDVQLDERPGAAQAATLIMRATELAPVDAGDAAPRQLQRGWERGAAGQLSVRRTLSL